MNHIFKYHPDPIKTGNAIIKDFQCSCCNKNKTELYTGSIYTTLESENLEICLDCIANGEAARKYEACFTESDTDLQNISAELINELEYRTPGYISWQGNYWLSHCNDICEFHGDFSKEDLNQLPQETLNEIKNYMNCTDVELAELVRCYNPRKGDMNPALYKFKCRHCDKIRIYCDYT